MGNWLVFLPEMIVTGLLVLVLSVDLFWPQRSRRVIMAASLGTLAAVIGWLWGNGLLGDLGNAFRQDALSVYLKSIILSAALLMVLFSWDFQQERRRPQGEYLVLVLAATLGMLVLCSSTELVLMYVGLELATFPLVLLTGYCPEDPRSAEGGIKYLLLAALGSALLLYGFSLLYAATGATELAPLAAALPGRTGQPMVLFGLLCVLAGVGFKITLLPFHVWAPDAYQGAPTQVTAFLSVASKTAGFALALRLLAGGLLPLRPTWSLLIAVLAAATMTLGNLAAIPQTNIKRLLAYSSIAQAGFLAMGLVAFGPAGISSLLYYLSAYLVTNLAAFGVVLAVERVTGNADLAAFTGLAQRSPRLALGMLLALLSLAGIPPLAGFAAKFYLFAAVYGQGWTWLVVVAVLNSALSLYYYLRVVRVMYILPPAEGQPAWPATPWYLTAALLLCLAGVLLFGSYPGPFVDLARTALAAFPQ